MKSFVSLTTFAILLILWACQQPAGDQTSAEAAAAKPVAAVELTNRFFNEVINQKKTDLLDSLLHISFHSNHFPAPPGSDKATFIKGVRDLMAAFPDMVLTVHQQFGEGDKVFTYLSWTGTQSGVFNGIAATNKKVSVDAMDIWREQDGQLIENWVVMDIMGLMMQLGVVPPPPAQ